MLFRNRLNPNLYRYHSKEEMNKHQNMMDESGFEIYREWEKNIMNRTYYFCEYREIGKA